jgi:hypothetical protein
MVEEKGDLIVDDDGSVYVSQHALTPIDVRPLDCTGVLGDATVGEVFP